MHSAQVNCLFQLKLKLISKKLVRLLFLKSLWAMLIHSFFIISMKQSKSFILFVDSFEKI